jgi:hypothetical protein
MWIRMDDKKLREWAESLRQTTISHYARAIRELLDEKDALEIERNQQQAINRAHVNVVNRLEAELYECCLVANNFNNFFNCFTIS